ncbi:hypothetical protein WDZ17_09090 [Pseudokineococcus basanitobsidens]|uniref:Small CPxCG-related zinc finger protein n=1 Tax=Pseudokineococcus basanitobsidens TaxID=1926649 RepID=A0ABU8RK22_9ACTN
MATTTARRAALATPPARLAPTSVLDDIDCSVCGRAVPHELVECVDGHGEDCPDRVCTDCGSVLVVGSAPALRRTA